MSTATTNRCERCDGEGQLARYRHPATAPKEDERIICINCASFLIEKGLNEEAKQKLSQRRN